MMIGVHIQEKQKIGENLMFLGEGGKGGVEAFQNTTITPPLGSGPAMTCIL